MNIERGEIINPGLWPGSEAPQKELRVILIEHGIWESSGSLTHKKMVFTEEIEGLRHLSSYSSRGA